MRRLLNTGLVRSRAIEQIDPTPFAPQKQNASRCGEAFAGVLEARPRVELG